MQAYKDACSIPAESFAGAGGSSASLGESLFKVAQHLLYQCALRLLELRDANIVNGLNNACFGLDEASSVVVDVACLEATPGL